MLRSTNTFYVEEIRDLREESFEGEANNMKLDKENAQRGSFHTKQEASKAYTGLPF